MMSNKDYMTPRRGNLLQPDGKRSGASGSKPDYTHAPRRGNLNCTCSAPYQVVRILPEALPSG